MNLKSGLTVCVMVLASVNAFAKDSQFATVVNGTDFITYNKVGAKVISVIHLLPSAIPGTVIIRQELGASDRADMNMNCMYLVKGGVDDPKAFLAAMKPENVIQFQCVNPAK